MSQNDRPTHPGVFFCLKSIIRDQMFIDVFDVENDAKEFGVPLIENHPKVVPWEKKI